MQILTRFLVFIGSVLVLALFAALIAPSFVDWDRFRSEFEVQATRIIGQPVKVGGDTRVQFLPLPYLSFQNLEVGKNKDGSPLMTVEEFSLNAELFPFLSGEVRIVDMEMRKPHINLQVDENGTVAWTNPEVQIVKPEQINIEKLKVVAGSATIEGLTGGRTLSLDAINADVSAQSIIGPWRIDANANIESVPSNISISTGTYQQSGEIRLKAELERNDNPYTLLIDGPLRLENETLLWSGSFKINPFSDSKIAEMPDTETPLPVSTAGLFIAQPKNVEITEYRMEIGNASDPYTITGIGNISIDDEITFIAQADGRQIDLDRIRQAEAAANQTGSLEERIETLRTIIERVPLPKIKGEIDLILPAVIAGDTYIRDVSAKISPIQNGWDLRFFKATFPGNTLLEAQGRVGLFSDFGFNGKMLLASRQPSGFANWIAGDVSPEFRQLRAAGFSANVTISQKQTTFQNLELQLDDARLKGKLQRVSSPGNRPAIITQLEGNRVNIDDLRAIYSLAQDNNKADSLVTHDLDVTIKADRFEAMINGKPLVASGVDAQINVSDGRVSLDRLKTNDFYGASIITQGRIDKLLTKPDGNIKLSLNAKNATQILEYAKQFTGDKTIINNLLKNPELLADTELSIELESRTQENGAKGQIIIAGKSGGTDVDFQLLFDGAVDELNVLPLEINAKLANDKPSLLLQQVGIHTVPDALTAAIGRSVSDTLRADIFLKGSAQKGMETQILLLNKDLTLSAEGRLITQNAEDFDAEFNVTLGSDDLLPMLTLTGVKLPGVGGKNELPVSASMRFKNSELGASFDGLSGQISGNPFSGNLLLRKKDVSRPRLEGKLTFGTLNVPMLAETVLGVDGGLPQLNLANDNDASFQDALYKGIDAKLMLAATRLNFNAKHYGTNANFELVMLDGKMNINQLRANYLSGVLRGVASLQNTNGTVLTNSNFVLDKIDAGALFRSQAISNSVDAKMTVSATLESSGRSYQALLQNFAGEGVLDLDNIAINGFTGMIFDKILLETQDENYEITPENIVALVHKNSFSNKMMVKNINVPFSISRGEMRVRNVVENMSHAQATGDFRYDFTNGETDAKLNLLFEPQKRGQISGADPQVTFYFRGQGEDIKPEIETAALESYLSLRAFENSQRRIETLEARVLETQRLQREIAFAFQREQYAIRKEEERLRLEEEARLKAEAEARERLRLEQEKQAAERLEKERQARELAEAERIERERAQNSERVLEDIDKLLFGLE